MNKNKLFSSLFVVMTILSLTFGALGITPASAATSTTPAYYPYGPQANVNESQLTGWELCWSSTYDTTTSLATILASCNGDYLLLGGKPTGSSVITVLAAGPRADVLFDTGAADNGITHSANGVGWYYNDSWSWGFVKDGDPVAKSECDTNGAPNGDLRLCWHTVQTPGSLDPGFRAGNTYSFGTDTERFIYQSNGGSIEPTAPNTFIDNERSYVQGTSARFYFSSDTHVSGFECRLGDNDWTQCGGEVFMQSYYELANGDYVFQVRAYIVSDPRVYDSTPAEYSFTVGAKSDPDTTAPVVTVPDTITAEATSADGAVVEFSVSANDDVDGALTPSCDYNPGDTFPLGTTLVTCTATDAASNIGSATFNVTVEDTTTPGFAMVADNPYEATSFDGATVAFSVSASDIVDGSVAASCDHNSGVTFALGTTTVNCSATDAADNQGTTSFDIIVQDTTAPNTNIDNQPTNPSSSSSAVFTFSGTDSASDIASFVCRVDDGDYSACTSGDDFGPLSDGSHTFDVRAIDNAGNTDASSASYTWTISSYAASERVQNGGLNIYVGKSKTPQYWVSKNFSANDGKDLKVFPNKEGTASVKMTGAPGVTKTLTQTLLLSGLAGDKFTFSFHHQSNAVPAAGMCQAQVKLYNGTTLIDTQTVNCAIGTHPFINNTRTLNFVAAGNYTKVVIQFTYKKSSGTVRFDAVSLIK